MELTYFLGVGEDAVEWWAWEMTPIPTGFPSAKQYAAGLWFFWKSRGQLS